MDFNIYTDGGTINNGKKDPTKPVYGAFGYVIVDEREENIIKTGSKVYKNVTNNQMEISGVIHALTVIHDLIIENNLIEKGNITVISDSQYVVSGYNEWLEGWIKRGWKNNEGKPTPNKEFWLLLIDEVAKLNKIHYYVDFLKVKGHKGKDITKEDNPLVYYNEMCDTILSERLNKIRKKVNY